MELTTTLKQKLTYKTKDTTFRNTVKEEVANITVASFGLFFSLIGFGILIGLATLYGDVIHIVSSSVYATTLLLLYVASILLHSSLAQEVKHAKAFEVIDHCAIYLLIAGTYTPFSLITLKGPIGWSLMAIVWSLAFFGILYKVFFHYQSDLLSTLAYVLMGWLVIFAIKPLIAGLATGGLILLIAGGVLYTVGSIFYVFDHKFPYAHALWHFFVLAASICHYCAVLFYVIPINS